MKLFTSENLDNILEPKNIWNDCIKFDDFVSNNLNKQEEIKEIVLKVGNYYFDCIVNLESQKTAKIEELEINIDTLKDKIKFVLEEFDTELDDKDKLIDKIFQVVSND
jgi:cell fate (sporulation/competence/biofilm development) regulator YmcA (YheA/YmcA/DUF963 family)